MAPGSADLLVLDSVADFLLQSWTSAGGPASGCPRRPGKTPYSCRGAKGASGHGQLSPLDAWRPPAFDWPGKAAALIESGKVQLNWRECVKPDKLLEAGDVVSARGFGKFELGEVGGLTRKGRVSIVLQVYV